MGEIIQSTTEHFSGSKILQVFSSQTELYIYDTANEVSNRLGALSSSDRSSEALDPSIVETLIKMLDDHNPFAKKFRFARDRLNDHGNEEFIIRIIGAKEGNPYNTIYQQPMS